MNKRKFSVGDRVVITITPFDTTERSLPPGSAGMVMFVYDPGSTFDYAVEWDTFFPNGYEIRENGVPYTTYGHGWKVNEGFIEMECEPPFDVDSNELEDFFDG